MATILLCANARSIQKRHSDAPYPAAGDVTHYEDTHVPFSTYGLPPVPVVVEQVVPTEHLFVAAPAAPEPLPLPELPIPVVPIVPEVYGPRKYNCIIGRT